MMLDESAERRFGPFAVGDYREFQGLGGSRSSAARATPARSRPTRWPSSTTSLPSTLSPDELGGQTTFIIVKLEPWADPRTVRAEIQRRLPYNDVHTQAEWTSISRRYWIESTGLGLTIFLTVSLGALVGVVIVAQTLYASTTEHLAEFGTIKALGGRDIDVCGLIGEQAMFAAALGFALGLVLTFGLDPLLSRLDMKMIVTPTDGRSGLRRRPRCFA